MTTARGQTLSSVCDFTRFWIEVSHNMFLHVRDFNLENMVMLYLPVLFSRPPAIPQASARQLSRSYTRLL